MADREECTKKAWTKFVSNRFLIFFGFEHVKEKINTI
jgi:hypothetical protein